MYDIKSEFINCQNVCILQNINMFIQKMLYRGSNRVPILNIFLGVSSSEYNRTYFWVDKHSIGLSMYKHTPKHFMAHIYIITDNTVA